MKTTERIVLLLALTALVLFALAQPAHAYSPMWFPDGDHVCTPVTGSGEGDGSGLPGTFEVSAYTLTVGGYTQRWLEHPRFGLMEWDDEADEYNDGNGNSFVHDANPANVVLPDPMPVPPPYAGGYDEEAANGSGHSGWWVKK